MKTRNATEAPNNSDPKNKPPTAAMEYFPRQQQAVTAPIGPVLVLAGPGAGKTRCLTGRIVHLIQHHGVDPARICAITFTNKAANEIVHRVRAQLGTVAEDLSLGTIHSMCLKILRPHARHVGLVAGIGVADEEFRHLVLKRLRVQTERRKALLFRFSQRRFDQIQLTANDEGLYRRYSEELRKARLIDFDEILILTRKLFDPKGSVLDAIRKQWDHVLVDECQDLDRTQYEIVVNLARDHRSLFFVGDDEQSIFSWRGADPRIIQEFIDDFGILHPIMLDKNCRCTKAIFETARRILPPDTLFTCREIEAWRESVFPVEAVGHDDSQAEYSWIVEHLLEDRQTHGCRYGEYAILYRTHDQGHQLEAALIAAGIPCRLSQGRAMSENTVVAQVAASLQLMVAPKSELALERFAEISIGERLVQMVSAGQGTDLEANFRNYAFDRSKADCAEVRKLLYRVDNIRALPKTGLTLAQLLDAILSQGVGQRTSPFEDILSRLQDPVDNPKALRLYEQISEAAANSRRVLVGTRHPLGIVVRHLLKAAIPQLNVVELESVMETEVGDLVFELDFPDADLGEAKKAEYPTPAQAWFANLFAALKIYDSRHTENLFREYVVFDTETTDLDVNACEVIELAAVRVKDGVIADRFFHSLISCNRAISQKASDTHGYYASNLKGKPTLASIWPEFREFVGNSLLLAHNAYSFDVPVLQRLTAEWEGFSKLTYYDSVPFARHIVRDGSLKLCDLAVRFGIPTGQSHHALDDCKCLAAVFERLQAEQIANVRKTALAKLLDAFAVGIAFAGPIPSESVAAEIFRKGAGRALGKYSSILDIYEQEVARLGTVCPSVAELIDQLGGQEMMDRLHRDRTAQDWHPAEVEFLRQLIAIVDTGNLDGSIQLFLDRLALSRSDDAEHGSDRVSLLTCHATKGLEFSRVYVTGVEDSQFPGLRSNDQDVEAKINEARRLLYVAMTRAKDRLCLTYSRQRNGYFSGGTQFLNEMGLLAVIVEKESVIM